VDEHSSKEANMISDEKQYEFITSQIAIRDQKAFDTHFSLFLRLFSAIVGGSIWLSMQKIANPSARTSYTLLSDLLVVLLTVVSIVMVVDNYRAWRGYRAVLSRLVGKDEFGNYQVPLPRLFPAAVMETAVVVCMIAVCVLFIWFNPFGL
jgi:hypothetical protein